MPQFNQPIVQIQNALGGMDKDTSYTLADLQGNAVFNPNDYADALNFRPLSQGQSGSFANEVVLGNGAKVISIGQVSDQNQIGTFPVFGCDTQIVYQWQIFDVYNTYPPTYQGNATIYGANPDDIIGAAIEADILTSTLGEYSVSYLNGVLTIENTDGDPFNFTIGYAIDGGVLQYYPFTITQEWIQGHDGNFLTPISSLDILGDLFILSTDGTGANTVSEIGVMTYNGSAYTYTKLLRTTELGLDWMYLPEMTGERSLDSARLYWVDNKNYDRVFVYNGAYVTNGALNFVDSDNFYAYGSIDNQTKQQVSQDGSVLTFTNQYSTNGNLKSGTKRYCLTFVNQYGINSEFTMLGNPVFVSPNLLSGGTDAQQTTKYNEFTVTGVDPNVFPFVRLAVVEYYNTSVAISLLPKVATNNNTITLYHRGNEVVQSLDAGQLGLYNVEILYSHNNLILDNRYVKSNFTERIDYDFTDAAQLLTLTTDVFLTDSDDQYITSTPTTAKGTYDPLVAQYVGYMDNETYRFGLRVEYEGGFMSKAFWIGDKTITPSEMSDYASFGACLTDTDNDPANTRHRCVKVGNWSAFWSAIGSEADRITRVHIVRTPCIPEVLGTGIINACAQLASNGGYDYYVPYFYDVSGVNNAGAGNMQILRDGSKCNFISPDFLFTDQVPFYQNNDYINIVDNFVSKGGSAYNLLTSGTQNVYGDAYQNDSSFGYSIIINFTGFFETPTSDYVTNNSISNFQSLNASNRGVKYDSNYYNSSDKIGLGGNDILEMNLITKFASAGNRFYFNPILKSSIITGVPTFSPYDSYYGNYIQYVRPLGSNKYGDPLDNIWIPTNYSQPVNDTTSLSVMGGDTFTQKTVVKVSTLIDNSQLNPSQNSFGNANLLFSFYSQNRVDTSMRTNAALLGRLENSGLTFGDTIGYFAEEFIDESFDIQRQYTTRLDEQAYSTYDPYAKDVPHKYTRILYSQLKPVNSLIDYYLDFKPLNFRDLDAVNGYISHMVVFNGELFTFQQRKLQRQFFNNDGILQADSSDIIVGNGSVLSRRGVTFSNYGTNQKWGVIRGKSRGGDDLLMWWSTEYGCILRLGSDGIVVMSDISKINRATLEASSIINVASNSSMNWGSVLNGVFDHKNREFTWTVRAMKSFDPFVGDYPYEVGDIVKYDYYQQTQNPSCFDNIPFLYRCKVSGVSMNPPTEDSDMWEYIPFTDKNYYALFTLSYSLIKERFHSYYGFRTRLYMPWTNTYLTPCPMTRQDAIHSNTISDVHLADNGVAGAFFESDLLSPLAGFSNTSDEYELAYTGANVAFPYSFYRYFIQVPQVSDFKYFIREVKTNSVVLYEPWDNAIDISNEDVYVGLSWGEEPYLEFLGNVDPVGYKRPKAIQVQSTLEPVKVDFVTDENRQSNYSPISQTSFLTNRNDNNSNKSDFRLKDNHYEAGVRNQTNGHENNNTLYDKFLNSTWWKTKVKARVGLVTRINQLVSRFSGNMRNIT